MLALWEKEPVFCFTSDIDWASDAIIQYSHELLLANQLKITYFNTHPSTYLNSLKNNNKITILIHPNFLSDSSHGSSFEAVMDYCQKLAPEADGFRCHRYFEVNDIMDAFFNRGFKFVSNHCTRCEPYLKPLHHRSGLVSIPIFLEDGGYLLMDAELNFDRLISRLTLPGLKVINVHPAHMAFNTPSFSYTRSIKDRVTREEWNQMTITTIQKVEHHDNGIRTFIQQIMDFVIKNQYPILSLHDIYDEHTKQRG